VTSSQLAALAATTLALASCAAGAPPEEPDGRRRPDGVSIDLPAALPAPEEAALASDGVAVLRTPIGTDAALELLHAYVRAIVAEDATAMRALHTADAAFVLAPTGQPPRSFPGAAAMWERRFERLDYGTLAGAVVVRESEAEVRRLSAADQPRLPGSGDEDEAPPATSAELVVRAPVATARMAGQSLLGSELVLYLRRDGETYRVSAVVEDFTLP
jgi:hypothetical protein